MAWLAVDKYGLETMHQFKPHQLLGCYIDKNRNPWSCGTGSVYDDCADIVLHKGTIKIILGKDLTFEDSPIQI